MRKFGEIYKEQQIRSEILKEGKVLDEFKKVYAALLEKYNISEFYELNEKYQNVFLVELNGYWTEEEGVTERGEKFLHKSSDLLNEQSTTLQKKNYLKKRSIATINETLRQSELKWKLYGIIDEMYKEIKASDISEVLSPGSIINIIFEAFSNSLSNFMKEVNYELTESAKAQEELYERQFSTEKRKKLARSGIAMKDGSFPIANKLDLQNAIKSYGRSKDKEAAKSHIKKRAKALSLTKLIPDNWK